MHFDCFCIESNIYKSSVSRSICVYCISGFHYATCSSAQTEVITTKESHYLALICLCVKLSWDRVKASYSRKFGKTFKDISAGALNVFTKRQYYETSIVKYYLRELKCTIDYARFGTSFKWKKILVKVILCICGAISTVRLEC